MPRVEDRPLNRKEQAFIRAYVRPDVRDLEMAAKIAGGKDIDGKRWYKVPEIREEIDRRLRLIELEQAALDAKAEVLSYRFIDEELAKMAGLDAKDHGVAKLNALRLALVVQGRIETRHEKAVGTKTEPSAFQPAVYGAAAPGGSIRPALPGQTTTTLRRTEEVIQTHDAPAPPATTTLVPELPPVTTITEPPAVPFEFEVIEEEEDQL